MEPLLKTIFLCPVEGIINPFEYEYTHIYCVERKEDGKVNLYGLTYIGDPPQSFHYATSIDEIREILLTHSNLYRDGKNKDDLEHCLQEFPDDFLELVMYRCIDHGKVKEMDDEIVNHNFLSRSR
jgi:hypothetical protein